MNIRSLLVSLMLVAALASVQSVGARTPGPKPIPAGRKAHTQKQRDAALCAFTRRNLSGAYKRCGKRNAKWDAAAIKFLDSYVDWMATAATIPPDSLIDKGKAAMSLGCRDALVVSCLGIADFRQGELDGAIRLLKSCLPDFTKQRSYPRCRAALVPITLIRAHAQRNDLKAADRKRWQDLTIKWQVESQADGSYRKGESHVMLDFIMRAHTDALGNRMHDLYAAAKRFRKHDDYFVKVLGGELAIDDAWKDRSSDWAYKVKEDQWRKFAAHLADARGLLTAAWKAHPEYPDAPAAMIPVAMAGHAGPGETPRLWFDRAVAAQLDHLRAYNQLATALLPRWGGTIQEMHGFAVECLNTRRFDTQVPMYYLSIMRDIECELSGGREYWRLAATGKHLRTLFEGYAKVSDSKKADGFRSAYAALCWYSGRSAEARRVLKSLGSRVHKDQFVSMTGASYETAVKSLRNGMAMKN